LSKSKEHLNAQIRKDLRESICLECNQEIVDLFLARGKIELKKQVVPEYIKTMTYEIPVKTVFTGQDIEIRKKVEKMIK